MKQLIPFILIASAACGTVTKTATSTNEATPPQGFVQDSNWRSPHDYWAGKATCSGQMTPTVSVQYELVIHADRSRTVTAQFVDTARSPMPMRATSVYEAEPDEDDGIEENDTYYADIGYVKFLDGQLAWSMVINLQTMVLEMAHGGGTDGWRGGIDTCTFTRDN